MAPVVTSVSPAHGSPAGGTPVTIRGYGLTAAVVVRFGSNPATDVVAVSDTEVTALTPAGSGTAEVTVTPSGEDQVGTQNVHFTYTTAATPAPAPAAATTAAPTISSLAPSNGPAAGGTTVIITGTNLTGTTQVFFGSTPGTISTSTSTKVIVTAPPGTGTVNVTVTTSGGTSNPLPYGYSGVPAPAITSLFPAQGRAAGGNTVIITGTNLSGAAQVFFGPNPATIVTNAPTQILVNAPAGTGTVNVTVTTPGGTSNPLPYGYTGGTTAPAISNLSPANGPTSGGNSVTITGTNLSGATQVLFGAGLATIVTNTATQLTVTAPPGPPSAVNVTVTTPGGTSNPLPYTYAATPAVTGVSPQFGPATGGNTVTVTGSGLALATQAHFGANAATGLTVNSDTQLTATAPPGTGTVVVTVTTPGGTSTVGPGDPYYTYLNDPVINSLTPNHGSELGGDSITVNGSALTYTDSVTFGAFRPPSAWSRTASSSRRLRPTRPEQSTSSSTPRQAAATCSPSPTTPADPTVTAPTHGANCAPAQGCWGRRARHDGRPGGVNPKQVRWGLPSGGVFSNSTHPPPC